MHFGVSGVLRVGCGVLMATVNERLQLVSRIGDPLLLVCILGCQGYYVSCGVSCVVYMMLYYSIVFFRVYPNYLKYDGLYSNFVETSEIDF